MQRLTPLLLSVLTFSTASYLLTPLLPIYLVESVEQGGLGWSRAETFSLFGTLLGLIYASPFIGGVLSDFVLGRRATALFGYLLLGAGTGALAYAKTYDAMLLAVIGIGLGIGCVKVTLATVIGRLGCDVRKKGYEYLFVVSSLGFAVGGLCSYPLFASCGIGGVVLSSLSSLAASLVCFFFLPNAVYEKQPPKPANEVSWGAFLANLAFGLPFFVCSCQLATGMPVFLHQCVDRTIGAWAIPAPWFGVFGSIAMAFLSPTIRRWWSSLPSEGSDRRKLIIGFGLLSSGLACASSADLFHLSAPFLLGVHLLCFIADFHVRPVLYASATAFTPARFHTISTALVFGCIGLGGKLAGTLASFVDQTGFAYLFGLCSLIAALCTALLAFRKPIEEEWGRA